MASFALCSRRSSTAHEIHAEIKDKKTPPVLPEQNGSLGLRAPAKGESVAEYSQRLEARSGNASLAAQTRQHENTLL
jgi:hypothetical protein